MSKKTVQVMKVSQLLDLNTIVVVGDISGIARGAGLVVVSVGAPVPGTSAPLVLPKVDLEVTQTSGHYLIARPPMVEVPNAFTSLVIDSQRPKRVRPQLQVDEQELLGNPAQKPVTVGDTVIRANDVADYVDMLAQGGSGGSDVLQRVLVGRWLHSWDRATNSGTENARIDSDGKYFIDNVHCFNISNVTFDPMNKTVLFDKVGVPGNPNPGSRNLNQREDLKFVSESELSGAVVGQPHIKLNYVRRP
jgi:hypothetical protein